jgi:signal transduction histidine kinase
MIFADRSRRSAIAFSCKAALSKPRTRATASCDALCREIMEEARAAHPRASFEYEACGELVAEFDHARIHQVLVNLLNNAVQHGDGGSPIVLALSDEKDKVCLVVRNHGDPIPPEALQVIFNPLVQVHYVAAQHGHSLQTMMKDYAAFIPKGDRGRNLAAINASLGNAGTTNRIPQ